MSAQAQLVHGQIPLSMIVAVAVVALVIGAIMILSVVGKYWLHQFFHLVGGPLLTGFGVVLIGLTFWGNVHLKAGDIEFETRQLKVALKDSETKISYLTAQLWEAQSSLSDLVAAANDTKNFVSANDDLRNNVMLMDKVISVTNETNAAYKMLTPPVETWGYQNDLAIGNDLRPGVMPEIVE